MSRTAAILVIGNEILTGKIEDKNISFFARELFGLGVTLRRVVICPDEEATIAADLNALRAAHDFVFTTGGVGPTHDDVTLAGVARAFDVKLERRTELEQLLRMFYGPRISDDHLRMADIPASAELIQGASLPWPIITVANVFVFPGVPDLVQLKFPALRDRLKTDSPFVSRAVHTRCDEGEIAELLRELTREFPTVTIGSYPNWREKKLKITFDGRDLKTVVRAADAFRSRIPTRKILRDDEI